ncbi:unnamed protein product, partial [Allacma fusca]
VNRLLKTSQNLADLSSIYLETVQNVILFVLREISTLENYLMDSNLTSFSLGSQAYALIVGPDDLISVSHNSFYLYEFYYLKTMLKLNLVVTGTWKTIKYFLMSPVSSRRRNFELTDVIALGHCDEDYPDECKWNNEMQTFDSGAAVDVFRDLQKALNFRFKHFLSL